MIDDAVCALHAEIAQCALCVDLPSGPRPVVQFSASAPILIIGQAPGTRVHASGIPWDDPSGDRLRAWTGLSKPDFYDPAKVALVPMGFCYPGKGRSGDLPPRAECAPLWHERILTLLPSDRLTLLVGAYAQARYLPRATRHSLTQTVQAFRTFGPAFPLPHPSWRCVGWARRNPWFESEVLPALRDAVRERLS
jgi:uracil-DNA glycosylase